MTNADDILKSLNAFLAAISPEERHEIKAAATAQFGDKVGEVFAAVEATPPDEQHALVKQFAALIPNAGKWEQMMAITREMNRDLGQDQIEIRNYKQLAEEIGHHLPPAQTIMFPDRQEVFGKVELVNFRVPSFPGQMAISNFPHHFEVSNFPSEIAVSNWPSTQDVRVLNPTQLPDKFIVDLSEYTTNAAQKRPIAVRLADDEGWVDLVDALRGALNISVGGVGGGSSEIIPASLDHGNLTTASGAAEPLYESSLRCRTVSLQSHPDNNGYIYIGDSGVTPVSYGAILQPGDAKDLVIDDVAKVYVTSDYNNEKVSWLMVL